MSDQTIRMLEKYSEHELKVSELYTLYSDLFPEDRSFWFNMALEEKNHASLIKSSTLYVKLGMLPKQMIYDCIENAENTIVEMSGRIEQYLALTPPKCEAYRFALLVERSPCEAHFKDAMLTPSDDKVMQILQKICRMDAFHFTRVDSMMEKLKCHSVDDE